MSSRFASGGLVLPPDVVRNGLAQAANLRFRRVGDGVIITNDTGNFELLTQDEFRALVAGSLSPDSPKHAALEEKGMLAGARSEAEEAALVARRKEFVAYGPYLHILITTLRCNQACVYCHASRKGMGAVDHDMTLETAERVVDVALQSPSPEITFEFQGGEPLANFPVLRHVVERAAALGPSAHKTVRYSLVTNLSLMDDEKLDFVLEHGIQVCSSLDGPQDLHDANRPFGGQSSHAETVRWMERINQGYLDRGLEARLYHVEALLTVTRQSLARGRDIVDEYVRRGLRAVFARPLNPFGFAQRTRERTAYSVDEFLEFYRGLVDYVIELNRDGVEILERLATIFLFKILSGADPNYLDIRSPCGAGIGQIAYNYDGKVFCCDEGRMLHQMGDPMFLLGDLDADGYGDLIESDVVRSVCLASCLEGLPGCSDCAYLPYCGSCPVFNYATQGSIFGRMPENQKCKLHMGILDYLFGLLAKDDPQLRDEILGRWVEVRERPFFAHVG
jgi:His-Xaa-Ser system radical SAM maturase HxsB